MLGMSVERRIWIAYTASWIVVPLLAGALGSRLYWGHWGRPPQPDRTLESVSAVQRLSLVWDDQSRSVASTLEEIAHGVNWTPGEFPLERVPAELVRRGLRPASDEAASAALLGEVRTAFAARGLLEAGDPGYARATRLRGYVAEAVGAQGQGLLVVALVGGEASNDHYPYYEARLRRTPEGLVIESFRRYWYDVAGIEGASPLFFGAAGLLGTAAFWIAFPVVLLTAKLCFRIARRTAVRFLA